MVSIFETESEKQERIRKKRLRELYSEVEYYFETCEKYGLKKREGQKYMALDVFEAIEKEEHLIVEAGVGIGKSFAYLVPLLYYFKITHKSFIISTSTIALQEQLEKDIQKLSKQLDIPIDVVVAKGMNNFVCLNRLKKYNKNKPNISKIKIDNDKQDRKFYPNIEDQLWKNINVEKCDYNKCGYCDECQFYETRDKMKTIKGAIICNHDLLIEDLSRQFSYSSRSLLKDVQIIVCDEAHNLENKIRNAKTKVINFRTTKDIVTKAYRFLAYRNKGKFNLRKIIDDIKMLENDINNNIEKQIRRLKARDIDLEDCNGLKLEFSSGIIKRSSNIYKMISDMNIAMQLNVSSKDDDLLQEELQEEEDLYNELTKGEKSNNLFWVERNKNRNYIQYAPKNISKIAFELFFSQSFTYKNFSLPVKTFILTSATLSAGNNDFSYFLDSLGANSNSKSLNYLEKGEELFVADSYKSPYNYQDNTLLYCCGDIANPRNKEKYLDDMVNKIKELILLTHGKALVLFTSKSDMKYVYDKIGNKIDDINIYIQNDGSSQDVVKKKFSEDINSVLFSTGIFWEGIDIEGEALSNLIIARLPFPIVDPILEYKKSTYGEDGFAKVYMPEMLIKLKQGVGRLIRSETDKGIISILDSRLKSNEKYKKAVLDALPIDNLVYDIKDVKEFVDKKLNKQ